MRNFVLGVAVGLFIGFFLGGYVLGQAKPTETTGFHVDFPVLRLNTAPSDSATESEKKQWFALQGELETYTRDQLRPAWDTMQRGFSNALARAMEATR